MHEVSDKHFLPWRCSSSGGVIFETCTAQLLGFYFEGLVPDGNDRQAKMASARRKGFMDEFVIKK